MDVELVDLHCHILPGIDDGARNIRESRAILEASVQKGIKDFVFTPHFYPERISVEEFLEQRKQAVEKLNPLTEKLGISFRVGAEIQYTPILASMPLEELAFSQTKYLLLELLPIYEPLDVEGLIRRIRKKRFVPILAHVERFPYITENPLFLYKCVKAGALVQVNAGWLLKDKHAEKRVKQYFKWNLVHLMASDTHSIKIRPQNLTEGYELLPEEIRKTFQESAAAVFAGKDIEVNEPVMPVKRFGIWK